MDVRSMEGIGPLRAETLGDSRVCIAVLDGPVDLLHPVFEGAELRRVPTLVDETPAGGPMSVHGTHVASLIFGQPGGLVHGIAPRCRGLVVPVFRDGRRRLSQLDLARAIEQAVGEGAHIINISGGESSPTGEADGLLERALQLCADQGVLVVAAVGNDGCSCVHVPAARLSVLAVGALGADGEPLDISNWGESYLANGVLAPGQEIEGATPGGGTASVTGSSVATPLVSGLAALLVSRQLAVGRRPDPIAAGQAILQTATPCLPETGRECRRYLVGTVNAAAAHNAITEGVETTVTNLDTAGPATSVADVDSASTGPGEVEPASVAGPTTGGPTGQLDTSPPEPAPPNNRTPKREAVPCRSTWMSTTKAGSAGR